MSGRGPWMDGAPVTRGAWMGDRRANRPIAIPTARGVWARDRAAGPRTRRDLRVDVSASTWRAAAPMTPDARRAALYGAP